MHVACVLSVLVMSCAACPTNRVAFFFTNVSRRLFFAAAGPSHANTRSVRVRPRHGRRVRVFAGAQLLRSSSLSLEQRPHPLHDPERDGLRLREQPQALGMLRIQHVPKEVDLVSCQRTVVLVVVVPCVLWGILMCEYCIIFGVDIALCHCFLSV